MGGEGEGMEREREEEGEGREGRGGEGPGLERPLPSGPEFSVIRHWHCRHHKRHFYRASSSIEYRSSGNCSSHCVASGNLYEQRAELGPPTDSVSLCDLKTSIIAVKQP